VNIIGAICWQDLEGKYLHCIKMGCHRIQLSFTTLRKDLVERAFVLGLLQGDGTNG